MLATLEKHPPRELTERLEQITSAEPVRSGSAPLDPWPTILEFRARTENDRARFAALLLEARDLIEFLDFDQLLAAASEAEKARAESVANHINRLFSRAAPRPDTARASEETTTLMRVLTDWVMVVRELRLEVAKLQSLKAAVNAYREAIGEVFGQSIADTISTEIGADAPSIELSPPDESASALVDKEMRVHELVANRYPNATGRIAIAYRGSV